MPPKSPSPVRIYGSVIILRHTDTIQQIIQDGQVGVDIEAVHNLRVATRRLRTAFSIFASEMPVRKIETWQEEVANLTRALGAARDCDVQMDVLRSVLSAPPSAIELPGVRRLLLRISQKREVLQQNVLDSLIQFEELKVVRSITEKLAPHAQLYDPHAAISPKIFKLAAQTTQNRLNDFLSYAPFIHLPECVAELHAMRISAKRLRYSLETFSELSPELTAPYLLSLKKAQDLLGLLHDCDVWLTYLPKFIEKEKQRTIKYLGYTRPMSRLLPGFNYFQKNRAEVRLNTYNEFVTLWDQWQADRFWLPFMDIFTPPENPVVQGSDEVHDEL